MVQAVLIDHVPAYISLFNQILIAGDRYRKRKNTADTPYVASALANQGRPDSVKFRYLRFGSYASNK